MRPSVRQAMSLALQLPEDAKLAWEVYAELGKVMKAHFRREGRPRLEVVKSGPASLALASASRTRATMSILESRKTLDKSSRT